MTRTTLECAIASMAADLAGAGARPADPAMPFALLGLDSLGTVELAAALERQTGLDLPPELVAECGNPRELAARLRTLARVRSPQVFVDPCEQMLADLRLPEDVVPMRRERPAVHDLRAAGTVLLTGATGFLGRWIARELIDSSRARLLCLVRPGVDDPRERLERSLIRAGIDPTRHRGRIEAVAGDLAVECLGLARSQFDRLAARIDAVCHAGAAVNWIHSYAALRAANVLGTIELLKLAGRRGSAFHFVSSVSVCYSSDGPKCVDEGFQAPGEAAYLRGLHLGYAQTKAVAEALVRQAGGRGAPFAIYRPALISGHSRGGDYNADDLLSLLIRGCVEMGTAPDLDWTLDVLPVEEVARRIVDLSGRPGTHHLIHPRPRHWRECVLWMRLYGYRLALVPFAAWVRQLEVEIDAAAAGGRRHPLAALRRFFTDRPGDGMSLPQLYEDVRRTRASSEATERHFEAARSCPELDAALLDHYFAVFRSAGHLPAPAPASDRSAAGHRPLSPQATFDVPFFSPLVQPALGPIARATLVSRGSRHSIVSDLTAWRSSQPTGLFRFTLESDAGGAHDVVLKVKARDTDVMAVGEALASVCDPRVGDAYARWQQRTGIAQSHRREVEIYRQIDPRMRRHLPRVLGSIADEERGLWAIVLEHVADVSSHQAGPAAAGWAHAAIAAAIDGLAALQAVWYGRESALRAEGWLGVERTAGSMAEMTDLWEALAAHARASFVAWTDPSISSIHRRLIATVDRWWLPLEAGPRTLIHGDFNPRNMCLRRTAAGLLLCAYDWELATLGAPQRDLAEFLCFTLADDVTEGEVAGWVERHRLALERETGTRIARDEWLEGFRSGLYDLLVDRLSMYALIHRIRRQEFLPRVLHNWWRLYGLLHCQNCQDCQDCQDLLRD